GVPPRPPRGPRATQPDRSSADPAALGGKKKGQRAAEQDRPDVRRKRARWWGRIRGVDPDRFVFLDELGANTSLTRLYGRAPVGERLVEAVAHARAGDANARRRGTQ